MNFQNVHGRYGGPAPKVPDHRVCHISRQINVPTILTPAFNHLLCFNFVRCVEKVSKLINHPVVSLLGTRVCGTSTEMITQSIYLEFPATTSRSGFSGITGIWEPMEVEKNVCQRLPDQDSSLR